MIEKLRGGEEIESKKTLAFVQPVQSLRRVQPLELMTLNSVWKNQKMVDYTFQGTVQARLQHMNLTMKEILRQIDLSRIGSNDSALQINQFSKKISKMMSQIVTDDVHNKLVMEHNTLASIFCQLSQTVQQNHEFSKNKIQKLTEKSFQIEKLIKDCHLSIEKQHREQKMQLNCKLQEFENKLFSSESNYHRKMIESNQRLNNLEVQPFISSDQTTQLLKDINELRSKFLLGDSTTMDLKQFKYLQTKCQNLLNQLNETEKISVKIDEKIDLLKERFQENSLALSQELQKKFRVFQSEIEEKIELIKESLDLQNKRVDEFSLNLKQLVSEKVSDVLSPFQKEITSKLDQNSNKVENFQKIMFSKDEGDEGKLLSTRINSIKKLENTLSDKNKGKAIKNSDNKINEKILKSDCIKNKVDLSQIQEVRKNGKKNQLTFLNRTFQISNQLKILSMANGVIIHNLQSNFGISIFIRNPDPTLYQRFSNNMFSDSIVCLFNENLEFPFEVIHTNMKHEGGYLYSTDKDKILYASSKVAFNRGELQEQDSFFQKMLSLNKRKYCSLIRNQFVDSYSSLGYNRRINLTQQNLDIYKLPINKIPVRFQISKTQIPYSKEEQNLGYDSFFALLNKKLALHSQCRNPGSEICFQCSELFRSVHLKIREKKSYEQAKGQLLDLFDRQNQFIGTWSHFYLNGKKRIAQHQSNKKTELTSYALHFSDLILPTKQNWRYQFSKKFKSLVVPEIYMKEGYFQNPDYIKYFLSKIIDSKVNSTENIQVSLKQSYVLSNSQEFLKRVKFQFQEVFGSYLAISPLRNQVLSFLLNKQKNISNEFRGSGLFSSRKNENKNICSKKFTQSISRKRLKRRSPKRRYFYQDIQSRKQIVKKQNIH